MSLQHGGITIMEDDFQTATLDDVVNELRRLHDKLGRLHDALKDIVSIGDAVIGTTHLDEITDAINKLSHGLSDKLNRMQVDIKFGLTAVIIGSFGILGTLRHWF